ncbi:hypothetical protein MHU86_18281 [Fragilaria crotonensis]|nr:hypothetical protein MHU86_18281 [Fragilaria crotonensis]
MSVSRDSVIQIRYLPTLGPAADKMLGDIRKHAQTVRSRNQNSARAGKGDLGSMHPIGTRICLDGVHRTRYVTSSEESAQSLLRDAVVASANLAAVSIPAVLRTMQDLEVDGGVIPRHGMAGDGCFANITNTMDVSVDLSNASHYDVNDASQGFSIWTEDDPGSTDDWYFVLPNVYGKRDGKGPTYNGMAIRLKHGVMISWDGRLIRHCTSMMRRAEGKHVYGTFFAAKTAIVRYGTRKAAASYQCSAKLEVGELSKRVLTLRGELDVAVASLEEAKRAVSVADRSVRDLNKLLTEAERALAIASDDAKANLLTSGGGTSTHDVVHAAQAKECPSTGVVGVGGAVVDVEMDVDETSVSVAPDDDAESWEDNSLASDCSDEGSVDLGIEVEPFDDGDITNPVDLVGADDVAVETSVADEATPLQAKLSQTVAPAAVCEEQPPVPHAARCDELAEDSSSTGLLTRSCGELVVNPASGCADEVKHPPTSVHLRISRVDSVYYHSDYGSSPSHLMGLEEHQMVEQTHVRERDGFHDGRNDHVVSQKPRDVTQDSGKVDAGQGQYSWHEKEYTQENARWTTSSSEMA